MESWKCVLADCRAVPSSCVIRIPLFPNPLTALANGSQFVYFLDSKQRKQLAVLKFSAAVLHISNMYFHDETEASMVTCCLADGQVMAFSVENLLRKVREQSEAVPSSDPLFEPFLGVSMPKLPLTPSRRRAAINAKSVSVCIAICPASDWVLISAFVLDNNMCMCRRSRSTGGVSYMLLRSHQRDIRVPSGGRGTIMIPSFVGAVEVQSSIASTERSSERSHLVAQRISMDCKPVFALVRSEKNPHMCCGSVIALELFLCLFGSDLQLSGAPVLLVGCQNGNVYFLNSPHSSFGVKHGRSRDQEFMNPLYSLAQPVVAIHTAYFPRRRPRESNDLFTLQEASLVEDEGTERGTHNAVIFVGQGGKIAVCHADSDGRPFPRFREFHVPGPVLSSVSVPGQCLLYSTPQGLHRICLRRECADSIEENIPTAAISRPIKIPEVSFKFPEMVQSLQYGTYLLQGRLEGGNGRTHGDTGTGSDRVDVPTAETGRGAVCCLCVTLDGCLATIRSTACADAKEVGGKKTATGVGREMKQCLQCIQSQSEEIDRVMEKIQSLNLVLVELKSTLDMLLAVRTTANASHTTRSTRNASPITCSFSISRERVGASAERLCVTVEAVYWKLKPSSAEALSDGWSLLVTSHTGKRSTHKSVSLAGLVAEDSVTMAMDVEISGAEGVLRGEGCIECFLHYSPHQLRELLPQDLSMKKSDTFKGVSLLLARRYFDILDFLSVHKHSSRDKHSSRETLSNCRSRAVKLILSESTEAAKLTPSRPPFPALLHSLSLPISPSAATNAILATGGSAVSADALRRMDPGELATALLGALVPATAGKPKSTAPRGSVVGGGVGGQGSELLAGFDGEVVGLRLSSNDGGAEGGLGLEIRGSSREFLVQVVSCVSARLRRGGRAESEGSGEESCDHATLCGKLAALEGTVEEIGQVEREISTGHQEWRTNCMTGEAYRKALLSWRAKTHSIYCKLREIL